MEQVHDIRKKYFDEGLSIRQIAARTGHDRATVKKYVTLEDFSPQALLPFRRRRKTAPYLAQAREWLIQDAHAQAPRGQRHTVRRDLRALEGKV